MAEPSETGGQGSQEGQQQGTPGQADPQGQQDPPEGTPDPEGDFDSLPEATKTEIRALRRENARLRRSTKAAPKPDDSPPAPTGQAALLAKLAEALGIDMGAPPAQKAAPASAKDDATASELRRARVELGVVRLAGAAGADPDALLDSRSFLREIEDLDPSDASFEKDVRDAVKAAVAQNPALKAKTVGDQRKPPAKSGGDMGGGKTPAKQEFLSPQQRLAAAYAANTT